MDLNDILMNGVTIQSSGTTGPPKYVFRDPDNIRACNKVAREAQQISSQSKILTVTRMTHAGGLLAQTLPAYEVGADVEIIPFNPYGFLRRLKYSTHTFLTPDHMKALIQTKDFQNADLRGKWILGGSFPVSWDLIYAFVSRGAIVQPNWGMSEIGPVVINKVFTDINTVEQCDDPLPMLGDKIWCDYKIVNDELYVKGDMCVYDDWFATGDLVIKKSNGIYYRGRK